MTTEYQGIRYEGLNYSTQEVNQNFKIKVSGVNNDGKKIHSLVGVGGLVNIVGVDNANTLIKRALTSQKDNIHCRLRRGLKISFYSY